MQRYARLEALASQFDDITIHIESYEHASIKRSIFLRVAAGILHLLVSGHLLWLALLQVVIHGNYPTAAEDPTTSATTYVSPDWSEARYFSYLVVPFIMFFCNCPFLDWITGIGAYGNASTELQINALLAAVSQGGFITRGFTQCYGIFTTVTECCMYLFGIVVLTPGLLIQARHLSASDFYGPNFVNYSISFFIVPVALTQAICVALMPRTACCKFKDATYISRTFDKLLLSVIDVASMITLVSLPNIPSDITSAAIAFIAIGIFFLAAALTQVNVAADGARDPTHSMRQMHVAGAIFLDIPFFIIRCIAYKYNSAVGAVLLFKNLLSIFLAFWALFKL